MATYRKRPLEIEAFQLGYDEPPYWALAATMPNERGSGDIDLRDGWDHIHVRTPEGQMAAYKGDWLIQGIHGELYPCKDEIFEESYGIVTASENPAFYMDDNNGRMCRR